MIQRANTLTTSARRLSQKSIGRAGYPLPALAKRILTRSRGDCKGVKRSFSGHALPPNDPNHLPGPLGELRLTESLHAGRVCCSALLCGCAHGDSYWMSFKCAGTFVALGTGNEPAGVSNGFSKSR